MRCLVVLLLVAGCSTLPASSDSGVTGGAGGGGTSATGGGSGDAGTPEVIAEPHQPDGGCRTNFTVCGPVCADLTTDSRHCGTCGHACATLGCDNGTCTQGLGCANGRINCDGACRDPLLDVDHCGSCFNRCSDRQLCQSGACTAVQGTGTSCASPLLMPSKGIFTFRFPSALTSQHLFTCGPLTPVTTRWLRVTSTKNGSISVEVRESTGDYVIEVFSALTCDSATSLACNDDQSSSSKLPFVTFNTTAGQTYFIAVGQITGTPGALPLIKVND